MFGNLARHPGIAVRLEAAECLAKGRLSVHEKTVKLPEDRLRDLDRGIGGPVDEFVFGSSRETQRLTKLKTTKFRFLDTSDMEAEVLRIPGQRFQCFFVLE